VISLLLYVIEGKLPNALEVCAVSHNRKKYSREKEISQKLCCRFGAK